MSALEGVVWVKTVERWAVMLGSEDAMRLLSAIS
jgi:hypothetical protein